MILIFEIGLLHDFALMNTSLLILIRRVDSPLFFLLAIGLSFVLVPCANADNHYVAVTGDDAKVPEHCLGVHYAGPAQGWKLEINY